MMRVRGRGSCRLLVMLLLGSALGAAAAGVAQRQAEDHDALPPLLSLDFEQVEPGGLPEGLATRGSVAVAAEAEARFLRLSNDDPESMARVKTTLALPDDAAKLDLSARMRVGPIEPGEASWHDARLFAQFQDERGRKLGQLGPVYFKQEAHWHKVRKSGAVPPGATRVELVLALFHATGTLEIDDLSLTASAGPATRRDPSNLLPGGAIETWDESIPAGWDLASADRISVHPESDPPHVRLSSEDPEKLVRMVATVPLTASDRGLALEARMRTRDLAPGRGSWHDARIIWTFLDAEGQKVGPTPRPLYLKEDADWTTRREASRVPPGAASVRVAIALFHCTGTLDLSGLKLISSSEKITEERDAELGAGQALWWGREPVEALSPTRGRVVLNGLWRWMPATGGARAEPAGGWGYIRVPGAWHARGWNAYRIESLAARGEGGRWSMLDGSAVDRAWYQRRVTIPDRWADRRILLDVTRLSTDAAVYLDGERVGEVTWPFGQVDLTEHARPGATHELRLLVAATTDAKKVERFLDAGSVLVREAKLPSRGLVGDVLLRSEPRGPRLDDVFIQTSVRRKTLTLEVTFTGIEQTGRVALDAVVRGPDGGVARRFAEAVGVEAGAPGERQTVTVSWAWPDPVLWEVGEPHLYTLALSARGAGVDDAMHQRFGFRQFRIDGRRFLLNEKPINLRPVHHDALGETAGVRESVEHHIAGYLAAGFNAMELWPKDTLERGSVHYWPQWARLADEQGLLLIYPALSVNAIVDINRHDEAELNAYEREMARRLRKVRNHPSIVMWTTTANRFAHADDQNPRRIGQTDHLRRVTPADAWHLDRQKVGEAVLDRIRKHDPTRPVTSHHAGGLGDVHTMNHYLCLLPLQEREQWLSQWAQRGDKPYMAVELGTPWFATFLRGRTANVPARRSERLLTEFAAWYLGPEAYEMEPGHYRDHVAASHVRDQQYQMLSGSMHERFFLPAFFQLQELYIRNTWRSWRGWGHSGGSIPWSTGFGWVIRGVRSPSVELPPFEPGRLGPYKPKMPRAYLRGMLPDGYPRTPLAEVLEEVNGPTLAWIAGHHDPDDPAAFTAKDHHFFGGAAVHKQIILHNDTRRRQDFSAQWTATLDGRRLAGRTITGTLDVGEQRRLALRFDTPKVAAKTEGRITLTAHIGDRAHEDAFDYRLFPHLPAWDAEPVRVFDPVGDTHTWLKALGIATRPWDGNPPAGDEPVVLVVGRDALRDPAAAPGSIAAFVEAGGRAVVFGQQPQWWRQQVGARVARYVGRRYWPVATQREHPILRGFDGEDFRDWNGAGTLVPETADVGFDKRIAGTNYPPYGWHWGNRGSVASAALEKLHHSGLTPLLEGQFDLAFSPLMEMAHGRGRLILTTLDLEGRTTDPVASHLTRRMLRYAQAAAGARARQTVLLGDDGGLLDRMGLIHEPASRLPEPPALAVLGAGHGQSRELINAFLSGGGRVLALPGSGAAEALGFELAREPKFGGSLAPPQWPAARGLSASDLRLRSDIPLDVLAGPNDGHRQVAADGLLGRYTQGDGEAIVLRLTPDQLKPQQKTYFRYSSWRLTRAIAQLMANLGARFEGDARLAALGDPARQPASLAEGWAVRPGRDGEARGQKGGAEAAAALRVSVGQPLAEARPEAVQIDGAVWYRRTVTIPEPLRGRELELRLGPIDDFDVTYVNGREVGRTGRQTDKWWDHPRRYRVPAELVGERMTIAVRVFDRFGHGGLVGEPGRMKLIDPRSGRERSLAGPWKLDVETALSPSQSSGGAHEDEDNRGQAAGWHEPGFEEAGWWTVAGPSPLESPWKHWRGPVTLSRRVELPEPWRGQPLRLSLGAAPGLEHLVWDGQPIPFRRDPRTGWLTAEIPAARSDCPAAMIELRFEDTDAEKLGLLGPAQQAYLGAAGVIHQTPLYTPGYRHDFKFGDDPFRYYRW